MSHWETEIFEYGLRDGKVYKVTDVENGLKCNCFCPECEEKLVAVNRIKGVKPRPHFRHYSNENCNHDAYLETLVHFLSKQIIESKGYIIVPKITFNLSKNYHTFWKDIDTEIQLDLANTPDFIEKSTKYYKLYFQEIIIERKNRQIKPDIQIIINGKKLIVEIAYSHFVDEVKLYKIKNDKIDAIEINLSYLHKNSSAELIEQSLYSDSPFVYWLNNEKIKTTFKIKLEQALEIRNYLWENFNKIKTYANIKKIYNCPIKPNRFKDEFVFIDKGCKNCNFFLDIMEDTNYNLEMYLFEKSEIEAMGEDPSILLEQYGENIFYKNANLLCAGHLKQKLNEIIDIYNKQ